MTAASRNAFVMQSAINCDIINKMQTKQARHMVDVRESLFMLTFMDLLYSVKQSVILVFISLITPQLGK